MSPAVEQVRACLEAAAIESLAVFRWVGSRFRAGARAGAASRRDALREALRDVLYAHFFCSGGPTPAQPARPSPDAHPAEAFLDLLSDANGGDGCWEPGWRVLSRDGPRMEVERNGLRLWAERDEVVGLSPTPNIGEEVSALLPKELRRGFPGFYVALGNRGIPKDGTRVIVRLYWHVRADTAPRLVRVATDLINSALIPFEVKVANAPEGFGRCDAGILYLLRDDVERAAPVVREIHAALGDGLDDATPALARRLGPGLGLAEDPGAEESFGMHRCGLLADAIVRAHEEGRRTPADRLAAVAERFAAAGLRLEAPHLGPSSHDTYDVLVQ